MTAVSLTKIRRTGIFEDLVEAGQPFGIKYKGNIAGTFVPARKIKKRIVVHEKLTVAPDLVKTPVNTQNLNEYDISPQIRPAKDGETAAAPSFAMQYR